MMFESNLTETTRIRMLEDRCRLMDEVIALRRERDALLASRSAAASSTNTSTSVPLKKRPASYFGSAGVGYSSQQYILQPPPPPSYRVYSHAHLSAAQVKTYPVVFTSLDTRYPTTPSPTLQSRQEVGHHRRVSGDLSTQEQRQTTTSPFLPMPTLSKSRSVSPSVDDLKRPSSSTSSSSTSTSSPSSSCIMRKLPLQNRKLPAQFRLSANTIVLGKGKGPKEASGNMRLKELVQEHLEEYTSSGRHGKMMVISDIIAKIQAENKFSPSFVRFQDQCWWEVTEKECRIKLSATFRDLLSDKYRSSSKSKVEQRRKQRQQKKELADSEDAVKVLLMLKA